MTAPDLNELEALLAKATPGPWEVQNDGWSIRVEQSDTEKERGWRVATTYASGPHRAQQQIADAELIVAAVNALPALIARVRELEQERDAAALAMRERCAQACEELSVDWFPRDKHDAAREGAIMRCAAAIRALEP